MEGEKIKLGLSSCLLGEKVRFDGGHQREPFLADTWGRWVEWTPVCPEAECGLGVPREPMRLAGAPEDPRLLTVRTRQDRTQALLSWARARVRKLEEDNLWGFVLKSNSPSCGLAKVKVFVAPGRPVPRGVGLFARVFREHFPLLPVEEEVRLHDPAVRENFLTRIFVLERWRQLLQSHPGLGDLVSFHTRHKMLLLAHSLEHYRRLGRLVAEGKLLPVTELSHRYQFLLLEALGLQATPRKHANVLYHAMGYFKKTLSGGEKQELLEAIASCRRGTLPLIVPVTLINHYARKYEQTYLQEQHYLQPHPVEWLLRYHA